MPRSAPRFIATAACCLFVVGCAGTDRPPLPPRPDLAANALQSGELSARTRQTLRQLDIADLAARDPKAAFTRLQGLAAESPRPEFLFALCEWSYLRAREATPAEAATFDRLAAGYAWFYLFGTGRYAERPAPVADPFDPRFRLACDLYNAALTHWLANARPFTPEGRAALAARYKGFPTAGDPFGTMAFAGDAPSPDVANVYRTYGLGVALVGGVRNPDGPTGPQFLPSAQMPATALLRFTAGPAELAAGRDGHLEFINPLPLGTPDDPGQAVVQAGSSTLALDESAGGRPVPLESDLTAPLGEFLSRTSLREFELEGFIFNDRLRPENGIYLMEPYQPGKIPVLLVHGLLSSPVTWVPLYNDLRAEPALRDRYQFWFYLYTTGSTWLESAADLRDALRSTRERLDPDGRDPALGRMVLIGHSMGGLVSRLASTDSGDDLWRQVSPVPLAEIKASEETKSQLKRLFYFARCPEVTRVVFIGTPHHGSRLSPSPVGRFATWFVRMPAQMRESVRQLLLDNPGFRVRKLPTSVDLLDPRSPLLDALASRPLTREVHYHSIIGNAPGSSVLRHLTSPLGPGRGRSDGVVPYASAHLEGVDSELEVRADHLKIHQVPATVAEIKRILAEHLQSTPPGADR